MDPLLLIADTQARKSLSRVQQAFFDKEASPVEMMRSVAKVMLTRTMTIYSNANINMEIV
jgi:hypothetical protein